MAVLRVVDRRFGEQRRVSVSWQGAESAPLEAEVDVDVIVREADAERVRWYLEEYAEFPADPAPQVAHSVESVLASLGHQLFRAVFDRADTGSSWTLATVGPRGLGGVRVEVDADPADVPGLPWELLREPRTSQPVVLGAAEFVRTHRRTARPVALPRPTDQPLRVLLVICRPGGRDDVPFRSVASRLVRSGADRMDGLQLDVLRPPTFQQLSAVLRTAADASRPYHVVHFDGHGVYLDATSLASDLDDELPIGPLRFGVTGPVRPGRHGYLVFEHPYNGNERSRQELIDGPTLAAVLVETGVPVLVLNACRSAYTEAAATPRNATTGTAGTDAATTDRSGTDRAATNMPVTDIHDRIRAYGSLAAEVVDAGVPGVVAMRYNVYVVTAAQFVADLYAHLVAGRSLGAAATEARKALAANPTREVGATAVQLQDWVVPTVYEPVPLQLRASAPADRTPLIRIDATDSRSRVNGAPSAPDVGFFGRDETLLALDRAFDTHRAVLLHAYAGAGKSTTAAEFARWYIATGGLNDPEGRPGLVLWTSFEHYLPLARVLDVVGVAFAPLLEANGIHWAALTDPDTCRGLVLQVLAAVPVLWVWDNVEPIAGFPTGTPSAWTPDEQRELAEFLRDLKAQTRAKVLLTSRRPEDRWLSALPVRVQLPPMPLREQLQLAHAVARHHNPHTPPHAGREVDWRPLLRFTGGNPLTITVTIRQALREHVTTTEQVERFVAQVQAGHSPLEATEDATQGRDASLAASLAYGLDHAFTEPERARLAVLHLFRDTISIDVLLSIGDPEIAEADVVPALAGTDRDGLIAVLDRAVEVGLLTAYGSGYYGIHPALPWFLKALYQQHHQTPERRIQAERAYIHAHAAFGRYCWTQFAKKHGDQVLPALRLQEHNLTHALNLARTHDLPGKTGTMGCMQGLRHLLEHTGRSAEWARLVTAIQDEYLDPITDQPLPGREPEDVMIIIDYRGAIARDQRDWSTATRLEAIGNAIAHAQAEPYLHLSSDRLNTVARHRLRTLAVCKQKLGELLAEQDDPGCIRHLEAAYGLAERIGDTAVQATTSNQLGYAFRNVSSVRDLEMSQHWHEHELALKPLDDSIGRAAALGSLANVILSRFLEAQQVSAPVAERLTLIVAARARYLEVFDLLPEDHHEYRAETHFALGVIYASVGDLTQAMRHYQDAIRHYDALGNRYGTARTRCNIAFLLANAERTEDARLYARAAFTGFESIGLDDTPEVVDFRQQLTIRLGTI